MTQIDSEHKASIKYQLRRNSSGLVAISPDNVARVEAMIAENSRYNSSLNSNDTSSSKACLAILKQELGMLPNPNFQTVYNTMRAINRENSTRLSDGELIELAKRLCALNSADILEYLKSQQPSWGLGERSIILSPI